MLLATAMWAPLLEKAYAAFAQEYGSAGKPNQGQAAQREKAEQSNDNQDGREPGYDIIANGARVSYPLYRVLYGPRVQEMGGLGLGPLQRALQGDLSEGKHAARILRLWLALDPQQGDVQAHSDLAKRIVLMTASSSSRRMLGMVIEDLTKYGSGADLPAEAPKHLSVIIDAAKAMLAESVDPDPFSHKDFQYAVWDLTEALRPLLSGPNLNRQAPAVRRSLELLAAVRVGVDHYHVLADHDYAVLGTRLVFRASKRPTAWTDEGLLAALPDLDVAASQLTMRNPHHRNSPNVDGTLSPAEDTGLFTLSLQQFLEYYDRLGHAVISPS